MSSWKDDSELNNFLAQPVGSWIELSPDLATVLSQSKQVYQHTRGAFDPSLGPLIRLWGFQGERRETPPTSEKVAAALAHTGFDMLEVRGNSARRLEPIEINLSAIAKGYAVDALGTLLRSQGMENFLIEIGGELITSGTRFGELWKVAIETPDSDQRAVQQLVHLQGAEALATSGNYRNYFESGGKRYQHIIDPTTGYPGDTGVVSVSVLAPDCATADAYATAFMLLGEQESFALASRLGLEVIMLLQQQGELVTRATQGFTHRFVASEISSPL